jgi:hypothetical protein
VIGTCVSSRVHGDARDYFLGITVNQHHAARLVEAHEHCGIWCIDGAIQRAASGAAASPRGGARTSEQGLPSIPT